MAFGPVTFRNYHSAGRRRAAAIPRRPFAESNPTDCTEYGNMTARVPQGDSSMSPTGHLHTSDPSSSISTAATSVIFQHIQNSIDQVKRISGKEQALVTISVSGGCDSVALLHACMECHLDSVCGIQVVHFNHQQRGISSNEDADFVRELCKAYYIPCHIELWEDYNRESSQSSEGSSFSQDKARQWRRRRLHELTMARIEENTDRSVVGIVLTAHHRDDSIESLTLKALRGVHLLNLAGIESLTPIEKDNSQSFLVRPWAQNVTKEDLTKYLHQHNKSWREDESNSSPKYLRNRVRNELLPLLQDITQGAFVGSRIPTWVQQSQDLATDVLPRVQRHLELVVVDAGNDYSRGEQYFDWTRSCQLINDPQCNLIHSQFIQSQALYQWLLNYGDLYTLSYESLQRILKQLLSFPDHREWIIELGKGCSLQRSGGALRFVSSGIDTNTDDALQKVSWRVSKVTIPDTEIEYNQRARDRWPVVSNAMVVWVRASQQSLAFREVRLSDYEQRNLDKNDSENNHHSSVTFLPSWKTSNIKIRQFLRMQGVSVHKRDDTILLVDSDDNLVAVQIHREHNQSEWILHKYYCQNGESQGEALDALDGVSRIVFPLQLTRHTLLKANESSPFK